MVFSKVISSALNITPPLKIMLYSMENTLLFQICQEAGVNFGREAVKFQANVKNKWHLGVLKKLIKKITKPLE